jgi:glycosyltransferase involved in cell wall biosynthesis
MKSDYKVYWLTNLPAPYRIPIFSDISSRYFLHVDFLLPTTNWRNWTVSDDINFSFSNLNLSYWKFSDFEFVPGLRFRRKELFSSQFVVIGSWEAPQYIWTALMAKIMKKKLVLIYESTLQSQRYKNIIIESIRSAFFRSGDLVVSFGPDSTEALLKMGVARHYILQLFNPIPRISSIGLISEGDPNVHKFLFVGQLIPRKNIDGLIRAFAMMRNSEDILTIVGEGECKSNLLHLVDKLDLQNRVKFVGHLEPSKMLNYYRQFDTLILPSFREVWGLVVNEALANGLQVVVSDKCGSASFVKDMKGVYITDGTVDSLVKQMKKCSTNFQGKIQDPEIWEYDTAKFSQLFIEALEGISCKKRNDDC